MNRAQRLLTLAYKAHQRGEHAIAGRITSLAFDDPDVAAAFHEMNDEDPVALKAAARSEVQETEDVLRRAEAATKGSIFTAEGEARLLEIAGKVHKAGFPKVAKSIVNAAS